jgi:hypothetical protein
MLPAPLVLNEEHLELLYRALGRGLVVSQYVEGTLYLAAFAAAGIGHDQCAKQFYGNFHGMGGRLNFTDRLLRTRLGTNAYNRSWRPIFEELKTFVEYRNSLAHFEVYHITNETGLASEPPTKYKVVLSENHMNAVSRKSEKIRSLTIELIESNNNSTREQTYKLVYFIVDHFPLDTFLGKGFLPITEFQLKGFYLGPRLPEFPPPSYTAA